MQCGSWRLLVSSSSTLLVYPAPNCVIKTVRSILLWLGLERERSTRSLHCSLRQQRPGRVDSYKANSKEVERNSCSGNIKQLQQWSSKNQSVVCNGVAGRHLEEECYVKTKDYEHSSCIFISSQTSTSGKKTRVSL